MAAIWRNDAWCVRQLIRDSQIDPDYTTVRGLSILEVATVIGNLIILRCLVEGSPLLRCRLRSQGTILLNMAAQCDHLQILKYLIDEHHFDLNATVGGHAPIHRAWENGNSNIVRYLMYHATFQVDELVNFSHDPGDHAKTYKLFNVHRPCCNNLCKHRGNLECEGCGYAYYCGIRCQREAWNANHGRDCESVRRLVSDSASASESDSEEVEPRLDMEVEAAELGDSESEEYIVVDR